MKLLSVKKGTFINLDDVEYFTINQCSNRIEIKTTTTMFPHQSESFKDLKTAYQFLKNILTDIDNEEFRGIKTFLTECIPTDDLLIPGERKDYLYKEGV